MDNQTVENDLMKFCSHCGSFKMKTTLFFRNNNQNFRKNVYNVQKSNKKNRVPSFISK